MAACTACSTENPEGAQFCMSCGASLALSRAVAPDERKVVTALFCDLVGFTATSEAADPEDVDRMLRAYFAMARAQVEAHGGVVEKFIGDAIVGVFGVPAAHEDDPERAVRAGLRIAEAAADLQSVGGTPLRLRVGINTGEVLVRLGVEPGSGERFLAGDAINTASRIQSVAPEGGVAVGLATYQATRAVFTYEELPPATVKGKAAPVRVFHPGAPLARLGVDLTRSHGTPFVGRAIDLALLTSRFDKAVAANAPQLVTVIGEPGLGKSRIVAELLRHLDEQPGLVTWRQGRCLPYGQGITFWALGEILKAHSGILESDDPQTAAAKLEAVLPVGDERSWFRARLQPLLGIEASSSGEREEQFTAWRRFLEHVAERGPTVLVFEDLHWADPALLAFLEHLADRAEGVPLLVIGTARPELFERHPDFGRGLRNHTPVRLDPLTPDETERLVGALLETAEIPPGLRTPVLERSGGNPLYAEEFVRLLMDRDLLVAGAAGLTLRPEATIPLPDSVAALIAARLDTLAPDRKAMLADAAVVGKVFWAGAVATMGGRDPAEVAEAMRELARRELVRPARRSSMEGEQEYAFWHVLARDVAYSQLPRAARATRHVAAAAWIESKAPDRLADLADVLAYHYTAALDLARAAGQLDRAAELDAPALRFLTLAGERALELDTAAALAAFERSLALTPVDHPERPAALARFGEAAIRTGRFADAAAALEEALAIDRSRGEILHSAPIVSSLRGALERLNDPRRVDLDNEMLALLERLPPGPELTEALVNSSGNAMNEGRFDDGLALVERALRVAEEVGISRPARALGNRGMARCALGDAGGIQDHRDALALALASGQGYRAAVLYGNLAIDLIGYEGPNASLEVLRDGSRFAAARGLASIQLWFSTSALFPTLASGDLRAVATNAAELAARAEESHDDFDLIEIRVVRTIALAYLGEAVDDPELLDWVTTNARRSDRPDFMPGALGAAAIARSSVGEIDKARDLLAEIGTTPNVEQTAEFGVYLPPIMRAAIQIGAVDVAGLLAGRLIPDRPYARRTLRAVTAILAEARGDDQVAAEAYAVAAAGWTEFGVIPEAGFALLGQGRCLLHMSRAAEAGIALRDAQAIFAGCGMSPALKATEALLAATATSTAPT